MVATNHDQQAAEGWQVTILLMHLEFIKTYGKHMENLCNDNVLHHVRDNLGACGRAFSPRVWFKLVTD